MHFGTTVFHHQQSRLMFQVRWHLLFGDNVTGTITKLTRGDIPNKRTLRMIHKERNSTLTHVKLQISLLI